MGKVETQFTGDPKQLLSAYDKLYAANIKLHQQMGAHANEQKRHHDELVHHLGAELGALKSMAIGYFSIHKAIDLVSDSYREWNERAKRVHDTQKGINEQLVRQISLAGHAANAAEVEKGLKNIPGASRSDALAAYRGLSAGADYKVDVSRMIQLARAVAPASSVGLNESDLEGLGSFVGELATFDRNAPADKLVARAMQIQSQAGRYFEKIRGAKTGEAVRRLVDQNVLPEDVAWGFAIEASSQDAPGLLNQMAIAATSPFDKPNTKGRTKLTPEEAAKMRFANAGAPERFQMLLEDPAVAQAVMPDQAATIGRLSMSHAFEMADALLRGKGTLEDMRRGLEETEAGRAFMGSHAVQTTPRPWLAGDERREGRREIADELLELYQGQHRIGNNLLDPLNEGMQRTLQNYVRSLGSEEHMGWVDPNYAGLRSINHGLARRYAREVNELGGPVQIDELTGVMRELLTETKRQGDERRNGPAPVTNLNER